MLEPDTINAMTKLFRSLAEDMSGQELLRWYSLEPKRFVLRHRRDPHGK